MYSTDKWVPTASLSLRENWSNHLFPTHSSFFSLNQNAYYIMYCTWSVLADNHFVEFFFPSSRMQIIVHTYIREHIIRAYMDGDFFNDCFAPAAVNHYVSADRIATQLSTAPAV
jgi:hypothetical protein